MVKVELIMMIKKSLVSFFILITIMSVIELIVRLVFQSSFNTIDDLICMPWFIVVLTEFFRPNKFEDSKVYNFKEHLKWNYIGSYLLFILLAIAFFLCLNTIVFYLSKIFTFEYHYVRNYTKVASYLIVISFIAVVVFLYRYNKHKKKIRK